MALPSTGEPYGTKHLLLYNVNNDKISAIKADGTSVYIACTRTFNPYIKYTMIPGYDAGDNTNSSDSTDNSSSSEDTNNSGNGTDDHENSITFCFTIINNNNNGTTVYTNTTKNSFFAITTSTTTTTHVNVTLNSSQSSNRT